jgi:hypothetical protein
MVAVGARMATPGVHMAASGVRTDRHAQEGGAYEWMRMGRGAPTGGHIRVGSA